MNKINGFTLVEVLVAVIVLAIGLLGLAGLQATSLRNNQSSYNRGQATELAYDIADRMRANSSVPGSYLTDPTTVACSTNDSPCTACGTTANTCTPAQMAVKDLYDWNLALKNTLPNGIGIVCLDSTPDDGTSAAMACDGVGANFAVKIWWDDNHTGSSDFRFTTSFQI